MTRDPRLGQDRFGAARGLESDQERVIRHVPVTGRAIQAMQFQLGGKCRRTHQPAERCRPHALNIHKPHVVADAERDGLDVVIWQAQALQDSLRHGRAHAGMTVEPDAVLHELGRVGLAHIVEQDGVSQLRSGWHMAFNIMIVCVQTSPSG